MKEEGRSLWGEVASGEAGRVASGTGPLVKGEPSCVKGGVQLLTRGVLYREDPG